MPGQKPAIAQPFSEKSDRYIPILSTICHPNYDIAIGRAPAKAVAGVLRRYKGIVALGLDVQAWGFTDHEKKQGTYELDVRLLRGYVSRLSADAYGLPSPSLIEVSFGSPCGFSGSPLLVNAEVVGILYSNLETKICAYSIQESTEDNSEFREAAYRIYEYGIAHRLSDLSSFLSDCT
jgi:hypothetical protein